MVQSNRRPFDALPDEKGRPLRYQKEGMTFHKLSNLIVRIEYSPFRKASLGQMVVSTGRGGVQSGRSGIVIELAEPGTSDHPTGKIIKIWWENEYHPSWMAFEDFRTQTEH